MRAFVGSKPGKLVMCAINELLLARSADFEDSAGVRFQQVLVDFFGMFLFWQ
jgi:hypothetical protein